MRIRTLITLISFVCIALWGCAAEEAELASDAGGQSDIVSAEGEGEGARGRRGPRQSGGDDQRLDLGL